MVDNHDIVPSRIAQSAAVVLDPAEGETVSASLVQHDLTPELSKVVDRIGTILFKTQLATLEAIWSVGQAIVNVRDYPDEFLTKQQQNAGVDGEALLVSIFAPIYTADQLRNAVRIYEAYPTEEEWSRLLEMRCPDKPNWHITLSHAQLLAQINDDTQRQVIEHKCAEEAYTSTALAQELKELKGAERRANVGRPHESPRGLKNQMRDLIALQKRFITRSRTLWLNEESDNIYDNIASAPPSQLVEEVAAYFDEIEENFRIIDDLMTDHRGMCRKVRQVVFDPLDAQAETGEPALSDEDDEAETAG